LTFRLTRIAFTIGRDSEHVPDRPLIQTRSRAYLRPSAVDRAEWVLQSVLEHDAHTCRTSDVHTWFLRLTDRADRLYMVEPAFQAPWITALGLRPHP